MNGVVLVSMPFGSYRQPSLALGLLKAALEPLGTPVTVVDATLDFAALITPRVYDEVLGWPAVDLLGDRIFAAALPAPPPQSTAEYESRILAGGAPEHDIPHFGKRPLGDELRRGLRVAEARVDGFLAACLREVVAAEPAVVGFTSMSGQHAAALALAARVKAALPATTVVFGGASCRGEMGAALLRRFPFVDAVATGEGEQVLPDLVRRRLAGEPPAAAPGLLTAAVLEEAPAGGCAPSRGTEGLPPCSDLDALPLPDYGDYFARLAAGPLAGAFTPRVPFEASRGCWWGQKSRCAFCGQASEELAYRAKSAGRARDELAELARRHPASPIVVSDEIVDRGHLTSLFPGLRKRLPGLEIVYLQARPTLRRDELHTLADAGVRRLEVGIESLSTPVLALMRKGTTALRCVQLLKWARAEGLNVVWNLIWGLPGETPQEYERMAGLVPLLTHLQPPHTVGAFRLDRFSPLFEEARQHGLTGVRPYPAYAYVYGPPEEALADLAYFFRFEREAARSVEAYTAGLAARVDEWKRHFPHARLTFTDDGEKLTLSDERPGFDPEELTVLDGEHRVLYLACDGVQSPDALASGLAAALGRAVRPSEVEALLQPLVEQGLVLREGRSYLALALPTATPAAAAPQPPGHA